MLIFISLWQSAVPAQMIESGTAPWLREMTAGSLTLPRWGVVDGFLPGPWAAQSPRVLLIEDAHTSQEAQDNIYNILTYLKSRHLLDEVWIEGAAGSLSVEAVRRHGIKLTPEWSQKLVRSGLVTGASRFWFEHPRVNGRGLESAKLYRKHLMAFRKVIAASKASDKIADRLEVLLRNQAAKYLSRDALEFLRLSAERQETEFDFHGFTRELLELSQRYLKMNWSDYQLQAQWPQLIRLRQLTDELGADELKLAQSQAEAVQQSLSGQTRQRTEWVKIALAPQATAGIKDASEDFSWREWIESSAYQLKKKGLSFGAYPELYRAAAQRVFMEEMDAHALDAEIKKLENQLWAKLAPGAAAADTIRRYQALARLRQAFHLRLPPDEALRFSKEGLQDWNSLAALLTETPAKDLQAIRGQIGDVNEFYKLAFQRDALFYAQIMKNKRPGVRYIAVAAGGFHRQGLEAKLAEQKVPYWVIRPRMNTEFLEALYQKRMMGDYTVSTLAAPQVFPMKNQSSAVQMLGSAQEYESLWSAAQKSSAVLPRRKTKVSRSEVRSGSRRDFFKTLAAFAAGIPLSGGWGLAAHAADTFSAEPSDDFMAPEKTVDVSISDLRSLLSQGDLKLKQAYLDALIKHTQKGILKGLLVNASVSVGEDSEGRPTFELSYRRGDSFVKTGISSLASMNPFKFLADSLVNVWEAQVGRPTAVRMANTLAQVEQRRFEAFYDRQMNKAAGLLADLQTLQAQRSALFKVRTYLEQAVQDAQDKEAERRLTPVEVNRIKRKLEKLNEEIRDKEREIRKNTIQLKKNLGMSTRGPEKIVVTDADLDYTPPGWGGALNQEASQQYSTDQRGPYGLPRNRDYAAALGTIDFSVIAYQHLQASRLAELRPMGLFSMFNRYDPYSGRGSSFGAENAAAEMTIEKSRAAVAELRLAIHADIADLYVQISAAEIELKDLTSRIDKRKQDFKERQAEPDYSADDLMDYVDYLKEDYLSVAAQKALRVKAFYGLYFAGGYQEFYWFGRGVNFSSKAQAEGSSSRQDTAGSRSDAADKTGQTLDERKKKLDQWIADYNKRSRDYQAGRRWTQPQTDALNAERAQIAAEDQAIKAAREKLRQLPASAPVQEILPQANRGDLNSRWQDYRTRRERLNQSILASRGRAISQEQYEREKREAQQLDALYRGLLEEEGRLRPAGGNLSVPQTQAPAGSRPVYGPGNYGGRAPVYQGPSSQQGFVPSNPLGFIGDLFGAPGMNQPAYAAPTPMAPRPQFPTENFGPRSEVRAMTLTRRTLLAWAAGTMSFMQLAPHLAAQTPAVQINPAIPEVTGQALPLPLKEAIDREAERGWVLRSQSKGDVRDLAEPGYYRAGTVIARVYDAKLEAELQEVESNLETARKAYDEAKNSRVTGRDRTVLFPLAAEVVRQQTELNRLRRERETWFEYQAPTDLIILKALVPAAGNAAPGTPLFEYLPADRVRFSAVVPMSWVDFHRLNIQVNGTPSEILAVSVKAPDVKTRQWEITLDVRLPQSLPDPAAPLNFVLAYQELQPVVPAAVPVPWKIMTRVAERVSVPVTSPVRSGRLDVRVSELARVRQGSVLGATTDAKRYYGDEQARLSRWGGQVSQFLKNPGTKASRDLLISLEGQTTLAEPFNIPPTDFDISAPVDGVLIGVDRLRKQPPVSGPLGANILTQQVLIGRANRQDPQAVPALVPRNFAVTEGQLLQVILPTGERLGGQVTAVLDQVRDGGRDLSDYQEIVVRTDDPYFILQPGMPVTLTPAGPEAAGQLPLLSASRSDSSLIAKRAFPVVYQPGAGSPAVEEALRNAPAQAGLTLMASLLSESDPAERVRLFEALEKQFSRSGQYTEIMTLIAAGAPIDAAGAALESLAREEEVGSLIELHRQFDQQGDAVRRQMTWEQILGLFENSAAAERILRKALQDGSFHSVVFGFLVQYLFPQAHRAPLAVSFFLESGFLEQTPFLSDERLLRLTQSLGTDAAEQTRHLLRQEYERRLAVRQVSAHSFRASAEIIQSRTTPSVEKLVKLREVQRNLLLTLNHLTLAPDNRNHVWPRIPEPLRVSGRDAEAQTAETIQPLTHAGAVPEVPGFFNILNENQQIEKIRQWGREQQYRSLAALLLHPSYGQTFEADLIKTFLETREGRLHFARLILEFPQAMEPRRMARHSGRSAAEWLAEDYEAVILQEPFGRGADFDGAHDFAALSPAYQALDFYERGAARRIYQQALTEYFLRTQSPAEELSLARLLSYGVVEDYDLRDVPRLAPAAPEAKRAVLVRGAELEEKARVALFAAAAIHELLPRQSFVNYIPGRDDRVLQTLRQRLTPPYSVEVFDRLGQTDYFSALWQQAGGTPTGTADHSNQVLEIGRRAADVRYDNLRQKIRPWITEEDSVIAFFKNRQTGVVFSVIGVFTGLLLLTFGIAFGLFLWRWVAEWGRSLRVSRLPSDRGSQLTGNWNSSLPPLPGERPSADETKRSEVRQTLVLKELERMDRLVRRLSDVHFWILRLFPEDASRPAPAGLAVQSWEPRQLKTDILNRLQSFQKLIAKVESDYGVRVKDRPAGEGQVQDGTPNDFEFLSMAAEAWNAQALRAMNLIEKIMAVRAASLSAEERSRLAAFYEVFLEHASLALTLERAASSMDSLQQDQGFYPATRYVVMELIHGVVRFFFGVQRSVRRNQEALLGSRRSFSDDLRIGFTLSGIGSLLLFGAHFLLSVPTGLGAGWLNVSAGFVAVYILFEMLGFSMKSGSLLERWVRLGEKIAPGSYSSGKVLAIESMIRGIHRSKIGKPSRFIKKNIYFSRRATTRWSLLTTVAALTYFAFIPMLFPIPFYETDWITQVGAGTIPVVMFIFHIFPTLMGGVDPLGYTPKLKNLEHRRVQLKKFYQTTSSGFEIAPRARQLEALLKEVIAPLNQAGGRMQPFDAVALVVDEASSAAELQKLEAFIRQMRGYWPNVHFQIQKQNNPRRRGRAWGLLEARRALSEANPKAAAKGQRRVFIMAQGSLSNLLAPLPIQMLNGERIDRLHLLLLSVLNSYQAALQLAKANSGGDIVINADVFHLGDFTLQGDVTLQLANIAMRQAEISRPGIALSPPGSHRRIAAFFQHPDSWHLRTLLEENPGLGSVIDTQNPDEPRLSAFTGTMIFRDQQAVSAGLQGSQLLEIFDQVVSAAALQQAPQTLLDLDVVFDLLVLLIRFYNELTTRRAKLEYHLSQMALAGPGGSREDIVRVLLDRWFGWDGYLAERLSHTAAFRSGAHDLRAQESFLKAVYEKVSEFLAGNFPVKYLDFYQLPETLTRGESHAPRGVRNPARFSDLPFIGGHLPSYFDNAFGKLDGVEAMRRFFSDPTLFPAELVNPAALNSLKRSEVRRLQPDKPVLEILPQPLDFSKTPDVQRPSIARMAEGALAAQKIVRLNLTEAERSQVMAKIRQRSAEPWAALMPAARRYGLTDRQAQALERFLKAPQSTQAAPHAPLVFLEARLHSEEQMLELIEARNQLAFVFDDAAAARSLVRHARAKKELESRAYYVLYAPQGLSVLVNTLFQTGDHRGPSLRVFHSAAARPLEEHLRASADSLAPESAGILSVTRTAQEARKIQRMYVPYRFAFGAGAGELDERTRLLALKLLLQAPDEFTFKSQSYGVILIDHVLGQWLAELADKQLALESIHAAA